mmetsp:Transcript_3244/g.12521  ORF Transcript_3244/g.12521 Transcript_3244/m.12521 type:complete len:204 (+) Transcript_3244:184-795(+)
MRCLGTATVRRERVAVYAVIAVGMTRLPMATAYLPPATAYGAAMSMALLTTGCANTRSATGVAFSTTATTRGLVMTCSHNDLTRAKSLSESRAARACAMAIFNAVIASSGSFTARVFNSSIACSTLDKYSDLACFSASKLSGYCSFALIAYAYAAFAVFTGAEFFTRVSYASFSTFTARSTFASAFISATGYVSHTFFATGCP